MTRYRHISTFLLIALFTVQLESQTVTVSKDGTGHFQSIQQAIDSFEDDDQEKVILIRPGIYDEKIFIDKNHLSLIGEKIPVQAKSWEELNKMDIVEACGVVIRSAVYRELFRCEEQDDWGAGVINIRANNIRLQNLTAVNSYGYDLDSDFSVTCKGRIVNVKRHGHQFTLRTMPPTQRLVVENCNFYSLGADTVSPWDVENGTYLFSDCTMEGGVDMYCPRGWAYAENIHFICHSNNAAIWHDGSADSSAVSVIKNSFFRGINGFKLGRFHRDASMVLIDCQFSDEMADQDIYQVKTDNQIQWGKRIYYYNCGKDGAEFDWFRNNMDENVVQKLTKEHVLSPRWHHQKLYQNKVNHNKIPSNPTLPIKDTTQYCNPIIHADYSDPDAIRVGDDYYMTASSFSHFPGLPILHSKDLINWTIVGHAIMTYPDSVFSLPQHGNAVWAPSIREHEGKFYIYFGDPDRGVFMTKAAHPAGPWSPLKLVKKVTGWIDCCPFWDDDGKAYLVHAFANSRVGLKSVLMMNEMSPDGEEIFGTSTLIFNGQEQHHTMEGPKMYKHNGYYYIFAPAGGVATGWQTVLRAKDIFGPYEDKIVLEQGLSPVNGPHQGAWVNTVEGEDWFIHFQDKEAYGRIVHLQPMRWENDWPVIGIDVDGNGIGEPVSCYQKPKTREKSESFKLQGADTFDSAQLGLQWQWQANPQTEWYTCKPENGTLLLNAFPLADQANFWNQPNLLLQKFPSENFEVSVKADLKNLKKGTEAGLIAFGLDYARIRITRKDKNTFNLAVLTCKNADKENQEVLSSEDFSWDQDSIILGLSVTKDKQSEVKPIALCQFYYGENNQSFRSIGSAFIAREGKWVGSKIGLYCVNSTQNKARKNSFLQVEDFEVSIR